MLRSEANFADQHFAVCLRCFRFEDFEKECVIREISLEGKVANLV
jgi:hypothetical protein